MLLSGSVGSAKSLLLAHIILTHCLAFQKAHFGIGRRVLRDLEDTLVSVILRHADEVKFNYHGTRREFTFANGSIISSFSWADKHYKKFRSHEFTGFAIEELTENEDEEFYNEIFNRLGRRKDIPEKILISATNPDDPEHWVYKRFFIEKSPTRHVSKTRTRDNPYLPESYVESLKKNMDPKMWLRMGEGEWLPIRGSTIYHQYDQDKHFVNRPYEVNPRLNIHWSWDFNIGHGKPLSSCFFQFDGAFRFFKDLVFESLRTEDMLEEALNKGLLDHSTEYIINGDATGKARDTRSKHNDYEIIQKFLANNRNTKGQPIRFKMDVPLINPKVRARHNLVNSWLMNAKNEVRLFVYQDAKVVHQGLMLTKLKSGADYIEDDSKSYQHVTTAVGYGISAKVNESSKSTVTMYGG